MERLLILNPGSTSTKLAVFDGEEPLFVESITHSAEELAPFDCVADQYEFRRELVLDCLKRHSVPLDSLTAIVSRGGLLTPIEAGAYEVNDDMVWQLKNKPQNEHASNVGAMIARSISLQLGIPAYIYDGVTVDELLPINKLTGLPSMRRKGMGHNLNTRAAALRYARENGHPSGMIFTKKDGSAIARTQVSLFIQKLAQEAKIPAEKGNIRALRQLYKTTISGIEANFDLLVRQAYERQLETEQLSVGWE